MVEERTGEVDGKQEYEVDLWVLGGVLIIVNMAIIGGILVLRWVFW